MNLIHHSEILSLKGDSYRLRGKSAAANNRPTVSLANPVLADRQRSNEGQSPAGQPQPSAEAA
jgi:hypothetical protein